MPDAPSKDLGAANPAFCLAPWVHLHVTQKGDVTPCCRISTPVDNVNKTPLPEIWNGAALRALRLRFLQGEKDPLCWRCYAHEAAGSESYRQFLNHRFAHHTDWAQATAEDGAAPDSRPVYWDIRYSNICNFRCRTCWHGASSRWFGDAVALGTAVAQTPVIQNIDQSDAFLDALQAFAPDVEEIVFAGGEPWITLEHYRILKDLIARNIDSVKLRYVTNLSELRYKGMDVIDLWQRFSDVEVNASLDGIGAVGELVRKDLSWPRFKENVTRLRSAAPHVVFGIDMTVSVLNLFHLPQMQRALCEDGLVDYGRLSLRALHDPAHYNIKMLPRALKRQAARLLNEQADWMAAYGRRIGASDAQIATERAALQSLITFMKAEDLSEHVLAFSRTTRALDGLRDETLASLCPELGPLIDRPLMVSATGTSRLVLRKVTMAVKRLLPGAGPKAASP